MRNQLIELIREEDKRNPLTDEECAKALGLSRSEVTQLRQSMQIGDSRQRRKTLLLEEIGTILRTQPELSIRALTSDLNEKGYDISRHSVAQLMEEVQNTLPKKASPQQKGLEPPPVSPAPPRACFQADKERKKEANPFASLIGWDKSLRVQVEQAKAAVLYPPNGLHCMIIGETGIGKSELAECMYKYARQVRKRSAQQIPFVVFNCADYADNPQLLLSQLFGYKKGAFTGAITDQEGLVQKADGGILFLDEIHRLPQVGQEILFQLIDKGKYRRLGETNAMRDVRIMIIAATTEDIEQSLLLTFRRRIPMVIELSSLRVRPLEEKLEMIKYFFRKEAGRVGKEIRVSYHALKTLMIYPCTGNVGQLRSDIQVSCASGFLDSVVGREETGRIDVDFEQLPAHIAQSALTAQWNRGRLEQLLDSDLIFSPDEQETEKGLQEGFSSTDLYKVIWENYETMKRNGLSEEMIQKVITDDLESGIRKIVSDAQKQGKKQNILGRVRPEVIRLVHEMLNRARAYLPDLEIDDTLSYCLVIHLNTALDMILAGTAIYNSRLNNVKSRYPEEFKVAQEMASLSEAYLGIALPEDEIGFIVMYLRALSNQNAPQESHIGLVVATHGEVAASIAQVVNDLLRIDFVHGVQMSLDDTPEATFQRVMEQIVQSEQGKGVLLLVDMGSLTAFGSLIANQTGITVRTVARVDTVMVIDAVRKIMLPGAEICEIARELNSVKKNTPGTLSLRPELPRIRKRPCLISICITGKGAAERIKQWADELLAQHLPEGVTICMDMLEDDLHGRIQTLLQEYQIIAILGTMNPRKPGIPFFFYTDIFNGQAENRLIYLIKLSRDANAVPLPEPQARRAVIDPELIYVKASFESKQEVIDSLCRQLQAKGYVTEAFRQDVLERENMGGTLMKGKIALPHGYGEHILIPTISVLTLRKPILWEGKNAASAVIMVALNEQSKESFGIIRNLLESPSKCAQLLECEDKKTLQELLMQTDQRSGNCC